MLSTCVLLFAKNDFTRTRSFVSIIVREMKEGEMKVKEESEEQVGEGDRIRRETGEGRKKKRERKTRMQIQFTSNSNASHVLMYPSVSLFQEMTETNLKWYQIKEFSVRL